MSHNRTSDGQLQPDPTRFPSGMKALGDYVSMLSLPHSFHACLISLRFYLDQSRKCLLLVVFHLALSTNISVDTRPLIGRVLTNTQPNDSSLRVS